MVWVFQEKKSCHLRAIFPSPLMLESRIYQRVCNKIDGLRVQILVFKSLEVSLIIKWYKFKGIKCNFSIFFVSKDSFEITSGLGFFYCKFLLA